MLNLKYSLIRLGLALATALTISNAASAERLVSATIGLNYIGQGHCIVVNSGMDPANVTINIVLATTGNVLATTTAAIPPGTSLTLPHQALTANKQDTFCEVAKNTPDAKIRMVFKRVSNGDVSDSSDGLPSGGSGDDVREIHHNCATQTGCFPGDGAGYPVTIDGSAGTSYRLTSDLIIPDVDTNGIEVNAPSVTVDLSGFEIVGAGCVGATTDCTPASGSGTGVRAELQPGTSVHNGSITGMGFSGVVTGNQSQVRNLRLRWNRGIGINANAGSKVSGNTARENGISGIFAGAGSIVSGNTALGNDSTGIVATNGSTVSGNTALDNGGAGIAATNGSTVSGNTTRGNNIFGISAASGSTVQGNTAVSNGAYGLSLGAEAGYRENVISDNTAGTVDGGVDLGANLCDGGACP